MLGKCLDRLVMRSIRLGVSIMAAGVCAATDLAKAAKKKLVEEMAFPHVHYLNPFLTHLASLRGLAIKHQ
jgi:hypothetical protein